MTETGRIAFVGGETGFALNLETWLRETDVFREGMLSAPAPNNVLALVGPRDIVEKIGRILSDGNQPLGMRYAQISLLTSEELAPKFVPGNNLASYDKEDKRMAQPNRKVGMTPRELAEVDGW